MTENVPDLSGALYSQIFYCKVYAYLESSAPLRLCIFSALAIYIRLGWINMAVLNMLA